MNSTTIAEALEDLFPTPTLHVKDAATTRANDLLMKLMMTSFAAYMPLIPNILNPVSKEYYEREREALMGASLSDIYNAKGASAYADSQNELQAWKDFFEEDGSGPFVKGTQPSFADFVFVAWLSAVKEFSPEAFEQFVGFDETFRSVFDACGKWRERNMY
jgi:glutathione S-transferase